MTGLECNTCKEQGNIHKVRVLPNNEIIYICYECDSIWLLNQVNLVSTLTVDKYLNDNNLSGKWDDLFEEID